MHTGLNLTMEISLVGKSRIIIIPVELAICGQNGTEF